MTLKYEIRTDQTIDTVNKTLDQGIEKIGVIIRHSDRLFSEEVKPEAFIGLTDAGKDYAFDFGCKLRSNPVPKLYSSFIGRCIETAYLIDKGYTRQNNLLLHHNNVAEVLGPNFIKDVEKAIKLVQEQGNNVFLRNWFDRCIDEKIMENPEKTADNISAFMMEEIKNLEKNQIIIAVSHDWSMFPLKEFKMNLKHETSGDVGFLDGILFFEKENNCYITNYQSDPILL